MKKKVFISIFIAVLIELFVFNFSSIKSFFYKEIEYDLSKLILENVYYNKDNNKYYCTSSNSTLELVINKKINNIYLDIENEDNNALEVFFDYTDDANTGYNKYEDINEEEFSHVFVKSIDKSKYISVSHLGKTHNIKISLKDKNSLSFNINKISFNKSIPFNINIFRLILLSIIIFSSLYLKNSNFIKKNEKVFFWLIVILFSILLAILYFNYSSINSNLYDFYSTKYKESLMNGKLTLDMNIDSLDESNLYDYTKREVKGVWDTSYYNGKFYMYFSFLPAIILGITNLSVSNLSFIFSVLSTIFLSLMTKKIIEKYFSKIDVGLKLLMIVFVLFNSRLLLLISRVRFYELIVICAFCFSVIGIYLYLLFDEKNKNIYLFLGSLFLSLSIVCRPNIIFICILGLFIVYKKINRRNILYYFIPYLIIGSLLMYINYIRFDNIFEFGIKYQLSVINMNYLKFNFGTILNGIYTYLFRMPIFITKFPYITNNISMIDYYGFYFNTLTGNGIIPMSIFGFIVPFVYKKLDKKTLKYVVCSILVGLIILILDNCFGGAVKRYSLEFSYLFIIPIVLLVINSLSKHKKIVFALVIISCLMNFFIIFDNKADDLGNLPENNFYYELEYFLKP